jgi:hypothetical protein
LKDFSVELTQDGVKIHPASACFTPALAMTRIEPVEGPAGYAGTLALAGL